MRIIRPGTLGVCVLALTAGSSAAAPPGARQKAAHALSALPLQFERNQGQASAPVEYLARGTGYELFLTPEEMVVRLGSPCGGPCGAGASGLAAVRMRLLGANPAATLEPGARLPSATHYFQGAAAPLDVSSYARVTHRNAWPGIDLIYYGTRSRLEYDALLAPGADPRAIRFAVDGSRGLAMDRGDLVLRTAAGEVRWNKPVAYQETGGRRRPVAARYVLYAHNEVGFALGPYDRSRPLAIDPFLAFSSYLGGTNYDYINDIAVDSTGAFYVTGATFSTDFPTRSAEQSSNAGAYDAFVAKFDSTGRNLIFSTYYGGSGYDEGRSVAIDSDLSIYVAGYTTSDNLPASAANSGFQTKRGGNADGFLVKLDSTGATLLYTTYIGGAGNESVYRVAVDSNKVAYVAGVSNSTSGFPFSANAYQARNNGGNDGFVMRVNPAKQGAASLEYSTMFGGTSDDTVRDLAVDSLGRVYLTGYTLSVSTGTNPFPITASTAYQPSLSGGSDAFVSVLDTTAQPQQALIYSTYLGSPDTDYAYALALDPIRKVVYITGQTLSPSAFPVLPTTISDARFKASNGQYDAFVAVVDTTAVGLAGLRYSIYLGGSGSDSGQSIAFNPQNAYVYVGGNTTAGPTNAAFPTTSDAIVRTAAGGTDGFVTVLNPADPSAPGLVYSTLFGGSADDYLQRIALDTQGNIYLVGYTSSFSASFPLRNAYQPARAATDPADGFFAKVQMGCSFTIAPASNTLTSSAAAAGSFVVTPNDPSCVWTAKSSATWITITAGATAVTGAATVTYSVDADSGVARTATITVSGSALDTAGTHVVTQPGAIVCTFNNATANPSAFNSSGGGGTLTLSASSAPCVAAGVQNASSNQTWLVLGTPDSSAGTIAFTVSPNITQSARQATVTLPGAALIVVVTQQAYTGPLASGLTYYPVTPCRVADTRNATGTFGGPTPAANSTRTFLVPQSACNIPSTAQAYSLNVTVVPKSGLGYLTLSATGQPRPLVSTLNSPTGKIVANAAIVPAGTNGGVDVYVTDSTDVVLDINGYFATSGSTGALAFYPTTPCRVADTRNATGSLGGPSLGAGSTRVFPVQSSACNIPSTAQAYSLNATVVPGGALGYLALWPSGQSQPLVSTLNSPDASIVANAAIVPAGLNGGISAYVTDATDLVLDINGYFAAPGQGGLSFYVATPCRVLDTRNANGTFGGPILDAASTRSYPVPSSACSIPLTAQAYSLNATVVPTATLGFLTLWPAGAAQPLVSTLNAPKSGSIVANAAIVPAGANAAVSSYVTDKTHLILDINGYFAP